MSIAFHICLSSKSLQQQNHGRGCGRYSHVVLSLINERKERPLILLRMMLMAAVGLGLSTPEEFLDSLAGAGTEYWIASRDSPEPASDSIVSFFRGVTSVRVTPGRRVLEETDDGYLVIFPESRWGYRRSGRIHSVCDTTVVRWSTSGFRWRRIPVFTVSSQGLGTSGGICGGLLLTGVIMGLTVLVLVFVRRRYRE